MTNIRLPSVLNSYEMQRKRFVFFKAHHAASVVCGLNVGSVDSFPVPALVRSHTDFIQDIRFRHCKEIFQAFAVIHILNQLGVYSFKKVAVCYSGSGKRTEPHLIRKLVIVNFFYNVSFLQVFDSFCIRQVFNIFCSKFCKLILAHS